MTTWEDLQHRVEAIHHDISARLKTQFTPLWTRSEVWGNDVFPLSGALTLNSAGSEREEDVVATTRFLITPDGLDFACDISREDGQLLTDGPSESSTTTTLPELKWAEICVDAYEVFLTESMNIILAELPRLKQ